MRLIIPFLKPLQSLIEDDSVSEVMVNGNGRVYAERRGIVEEISGVIIDGQVFRVGIKNIARQLGREFGESSPVLDSRLPNGARICAVWPTVSLGKYPTLNIRKFQSWKSIRDLVALGSLPIEALEYLKEAVAQRRNILISGGVGTGKTVLLRALAGLIDKDQRIITIEDTAELSIDSHPNVVTLEGKAQECDATGQIITPAITARMLVKLAMRQRGDRLIVGECRGAEAWDLLKALNSGSSGSFTSIHADTAEMALEKLAMYTLEANTGMPMAAIYRNIGSAVHYVLQQERRPDGSRGVAELLGIDRHNGEAFEKRVLYRRSIDMTKKAVA